ncbi:serine hydrolase, partial [SCandidatus Aminicenantes bacterium Aminicenantia_JdfR_composite]|nr:serine hydrolase [SCandidatus Aminicenantes bacterium Aminicenantia_JdfR_composite]
ILSSPYLSARDSKYAEKIKSIEDFVKKQMKVDRIPGLSIGFIKDNFMWAKGFGYADLENRVPATEKTAYRLASNTKSMTAVAILQLAEKGKIDLDAEVQTYVPYFPWKRWPITIRQLLGHLGGISHYRDYDKEGHIKVHKDTREAIEIFANFDLVAEPGTKYNYSSYGYNLLGAVIESASKQPYGDYMKEHIWGPLGMTNTYMDNPDEIIPNRAKGYRIIDGELKNSEYVDISSRFAAGGTRSTVVDLLKYAKGLHSGKILSKKSIDLMETSMATRDGKFTDYGMGWRIIPVNGRFQAYHTGGQPETRTLLARFPTMNFAIALAYNLEGGNLHIYSHRLFQILFDEAWNMRVYTGNKEDDALYRAIWDTFNYGLSYYDRNKKPLSLDKNSLKEAFLYFNKYVNPESIHSDYVRTYKKILHGRHPIAGQAFVKVGSFIAYKLIENFGEKKLNYYHKMGAICFFNDYINLYKTQSSFPEEFKLQNSTEQKISLWHKEWEKTCNQYTRTVFIAPYSDLDGIIKKLKRIFSSHTIYPNLAQDFGSTIEYLYLNGDEKRAILIASSTLELYPESAIPLVYLGNAYICIGDLRRAREYYKKALSAKTDKFAVTPRFINRYAHNFIMYKKFDEAMNLLKIASQFFPKESSFYYGIAEIYLKKARYFYEKALKADPTNENARKKLKKIK